MILLRPFYRISGILLLAGLLPFSALADTTNEERIRTAKAAFISKISLFVSWSQYHDQSSGVKRDICFYQEDFLGSAVTFIAGENKHSVVNINVVDQPKQLAPCRLLLVGPDQLERFSEVQAELLPVGVLTIADLTEKQSVGTALDGVVVGLVRSGSKMGFEVNLSEARRLELQIRSELLKHAKIVGGMPAKQEGI